MGVEAPLTVKIVKGELVIRIGFAALKQAAEMMEDNHPYDEKTGDFKTLWKISDQEELAKDTANELQDEREDGSTILTDCLDKALLAAIENGSMAADDDTDENER